MNVTIRSLVATALVTVAVAPATPAATPKEIDAAIQKGAGWLKNLYAKGAPGAAPGQGANNHGVGPTCLAGLALLESGTPVTDPALRTITAIVREAASREHKTYQASLCLMYLDRLGDPADVPLIQALAARLIVGQTPNGGWTYESTDVVPPADAQWLKARKADQKPGKLHPDIEKYGNALAARKAQGGAGAPGAVVGALGGDDNSNSQFAIIALWMARKHGVPVEGALDRVEKRYLATQNQRTGGWNYSGIGPEVAGISPSMHCAGLIGLSTSLARREDRLNKTELVKKKDPSPKADPGGKKGDDPFFNPPSSGAGGGEDSKKANSPRPPDVRDRAVQFAFTGLGMILAESARAGRGGLYLAGGGSGAGFGRHDLYFYWSLERVGVIYGVDKIGDVDWYDAGARTLVAAQGQDGSWQGVYGAEVDTSFAVLFLCKSNLARDLSSKVQKEVSTEMRAGAGPSTPAPKTAPTTGSTAGPSQFIPNPVIRGPEGNEAAVIAGELLRASGKDWGGTLSRLRDSKGSVYTQALVASASRLEGDRQKETRTALAERLTRMTAQTLRTMAKDEEVELRRGAVLAMAMKDEKAHIPDLVAALMDDEELVVRAAKAGLKSLAGQDFGPRVNATPADKKFAVDSWNEWLRKQKR